MSVTKREMPGWLEAALVTLAALAVLTAVVVFAMALGNGTKRDNDNRCRGLFAVARTREDSLAIMRDQYNGVCAELVGRTLNSEHRP